MTPDDHAAYAALDLPPGRPWADVHHAWRRLVKRHHPDSNPCAGDDDARRMHEINAAYARLRGTAPRPAAGAPGQVVRCGRGSALRGDLWERVWDAREWTGWMPGISDAAGVVGLGDRRISAEGRWAGQRWSAVLVFSGVTPWRRLCARLLELRVGGRVVELGAPPRVWVDMRADGDETAVEIGLSWTGAAAGQLFVAAGPVLELALAGFLGTPGAAVELPAPRDAEGRWRPAA